MHKKFLSLLFGVVIGLTTPTVTQAQNTTASTTQTPQDYIACKALKNFGERSYPYKFKNDFKAKFGDCQQSDATIANLKSWIDQRQDKKQCGKDRECQDEKNDTDHIIETIQSQKDIVALFENTTPDVIKRLPSRRVKPQVQLTADELTYLEQLSENQPDILVQDSNIDNASSTDTNKDGQVENNWWSQLKEILTPLYIIFFLIALGILAIIMYTIVKTIKTTEITEFFSNKDDDTLSTHQSTDIYEHHHSLEQQIQDLEQENKNLRQKYIEQNQRIQSLESRITELEQIIHTLQSNLTNFNQATPQRQNVHDDALVHDNCFTNTPKYSPSFTPPAETSDSGTTQIYYAATSQNNTFDIKKLQKEKNDNSLYKLRINTQTEEAEIEFVEQSAQASNIAIRNYSSYLAPICDVINYQSTYEAEDKIVQNIEPGIGKISGNTCTVIKKCVVKLVPKNS